MACQSNQTLGSGEHVRLQHCCNGVQNPVLWLHSLSD